MRQGSHREVPSTRDLSPTSPLSQKLCSLLDAISEIREGDTIVCGGFIGAGHPEALTRTIEKNFLEYGKPRQLTLVYAAGQGDGRDRGLNHLAHAGLLRRVIGGHWGLCPRLGKLAIDGAIEAYNFPQGVICQLLRDIAAGRPGCITHVGLETFMDPLLGGGQLNARTTEPLVERVQLRGKTWLMYHTFPVNIGLIRATAADPFGNLVMDEEAVIGDVLPIAQAVHNHRGCVIAQVRRLLEHPAPPQSVRVPGILVDRIVLADAEDHWQTFGESFNPGYCHARKPRLSEDCDPVCSAALPTLRRIIANRACDELRVGMLANLGIGLPEGVAQVAADRGILNGITLTVESGPMGGVPAGGLSFGASLHPEAIVDQPAQFDFYDGGGLDFAALGAAQADKFGNINVSRFGSRFAGVGGFVNISQNARQLVFCGTFRTDGLQVEIHEGRLKIVQEGRVAKFVQQVEQISFAGPLARVSHRNVMLVTERAVFRLISKGWQLTEIAPGLDLQRDILDQMEFEPVITTIEQMKLPA